MSEEKVEEPDYSQARDAARAAGVEPEEPSDLTERILSAIEQLKKITSGEVPLSIRDVLNAGRDIWGEERLDLEGVIVRLGVNMGKLCRVARGADKDYHGLDREEGRRRDTALVMGHTIVSLIRWADDLGIDVTKAVVEALMLQANFAAENTRR